MELIRPEETDALPPDPTAAFVEMERICRSRLRDALDNAHNNYDVDHLKIEYVTIITAAASAYGVVDFGGFDEADFDEREFKKFYKRAMYEVTKLDIQLRRRRGTESVGLDQGAKARLAIHLDAMKSAVEHAELPEKKKEILRAKLAEFAAELLKERSSLTKMLANVALAVAILQQSTSTVSSVQDVIAKLPSTAHAILVLLGKEKAEEQANTPDPLSIPSSQEPKLLTVASHNGRPAAFDDDLNDDVPF